MGVAFRGMTRAATSGGHAPTCSCEASIMQEQNLLSRDSLHVTCDTLCAAWVCGKKLAPLDPQVTGAIRIALSRQTGGSMTLFRQCLRDGIASRPSILQGALFRHAIVYKKRALMVFASHSAGTTTRRALMAIGGALRSSSLSPLAAHQSIN